MDTSTDVNFIREKCEKDTVAFLADGNVRNLITNPNPAEYTLELSEPIKLVFGLDILDATIPSSVFNIDSHNSILSYWLMDNPCSPETASWIKESMCLDEEYVNKIVGASKAEFMMYNATVSDNYPAAGPGVCVFGSGSNVFISSNNIVLGSSNNNIVLGSSNNNMFGSSNNNIEDYDFFGFNFPVSTNLTSTELLFFDHGFINNMNTTTETIKEDIKGIVGIDGSYCVIGDTICFADYDVLEKYFNDDEKIENVVDAILSFKDAIELVDDDNKCRANIFIKTYEKRTALRSSSKFLHVPGTLPFASFPRTFASFVMDEDANIYLAMESSFACYNSYGEILWRVDTKVGENGGKMLPLYEKSSLIFMSFTTNAVYAMTLNSVIKFPALFVRDIAITIDYAVVLLFEKSFTSYDLNGTQSNHVDTDVDFENVCMSGSREALYIIGVTTSKVTIFKYDNTFKICYKKDIDTTCRPVCCAANSKMLVIAFSDMSVRVFNPKTLETRHIHTFTQGIKQIDIDDVANIFYVILSDSKKYECFIDRDKRVLNVNQYTKWYPFPKRPNTSDKGVNFATNVNTNLRRGFYSQVPDIINEFNFIDPNIMISLDSITSRLKFQISSKRASSQKTFETLKPILNSLAPMRVRHAKFFFVDIEKSSIKGIIGLDNSASNVLLSDNFGNMISSGVVNMRLITYVILRCKEIEENVFRSDVAGACGIGMFKIIDINDVLNFRYDFTNFIQRPFHPISKLSKLSFRFENLDGSLCNFNGNAAVLILGIKRYMPQAPGNFGTSYVLNPNYDPDFRTYQMNAMELQQRFSKETPRIELPTISNFVREHNIHAIDPKRRLPIRQDFEDHEDDDSEDSYPKRTDYSSDGCSVGCDSVSNFSSSVWSDVESTKRVDFFK